MSQPSNLAGIVQDLAARVQTAPIEQTVTNVTPVNSPYWVCQRGSGFAVASTDWDTDFNADAVTLIDYDVATPSGFLHLLSDTNQYPQRCLIAWDAAIAYNISCLVHVSGAATVQVKFNGVLTNYAATTAITLQGVTGRNVLRIAHDGNADSASFEGRLFDGVNGTFLDLRALGFRWRN